MLARFIRTMCISFVLYVNSSFAQPSNIDTSVFGKWPSIRDASATLSKDGKYYLYIINNQPVEKYSTLIIRSVDSAVNIEIVNALSPSFSLDSKHVIYKNSKDSLIIISLKDQSQEFVSKVFSFNLYNNGIEEWLCYSIKDINRSIGVRNTLTNKSYLFQNVSGYIMSEDISKLLFKENKKGFGKISLKLFNLKDSSLNKVYEGSNPDDLIFNKKGDEFAFTDEDTIYNDKVQKSILWYQIKSQKSSVILTEKSNILKDSSRIANLVGFSNDGRRVLFKVKSPDADLKHNHITIGVDVWGYKDPKLQSLQLYDNSSERLYTCALDLPSLKVIQIENEYQTIINFDKNVNDEYLLVLKTQMGDLYGEWNWNKKALVDVSLISTLNGSRVDLAKSQDILSAMNYQISPSGRYVIYYNPRLKNYFTYAIETGKTINITEKIKANWTSPFDDIPSSGYITRGLAGWMKNDSSVLIYAEKDIFKIDPSGRLAAQNITNGIGQKNSIIFSMALDENKDNIIHSDSILLNAFNLVNKDEGFYRVDMKKGNGSLEALSMQPYLFKGTYNVGYVPHVLIKASKANVYIVSRMSAEESPNYFLTNNFKKFTPISNVNPEKKYNWLTSQLVTYKTINGEISRGVIYKPSNFNPNKRYPLIIYYYEQLSDCLHKYLMPDACGGAINIPYFVSNGYIVFTPDIEYSMGYPGRSAYNSIIAAAKYLSKIAFIDSARMAIQGHSFGGFETNYLITHTNMFAAAISSCGLSDFISSYGSLQGEGNSMQAFYELNQTRIGKNLWDRQDLYIGNSPVLLANKVTTPLLMMANKQDPVVPFSQGVEFFTALRRLDKRVWMLQYDGADHGVFGKQALDYTIRMKQFFDHYLKSAAPPIWMTKGIPARLRKIETGYEFDLSGSCCIECKVCHFWNLKYKLDSVRAIMAAKEKL